MQGEFDEPEVEYSDRGVARGGEEDLMEHVPDVVHEDVDYEQEGGQSDPQEIEVTREGW